VEVNNWLPACLAIGRGLLLRAAACCCRCAAAGDGLGAARFMLRGLGLLCTLASPRITVLSGPAAAAMSEHFAADNLLAASAVRERMAQPGVVPIRIEADFVTCTQ